MSDDFQTLYRKMCSGLTFAELERIRLQLRALDDNDQLLAALEDELAVEGWGCLCKLIWVIPEPTPKLYSGFLCKLLDDHREIEIMEAVADAMFTLKDEKTVSSLIGVLNFYLVGDPDYHFNRKIIYALANIGSAEAVAGIESALNSPHAIIRSTARNELERLGVRRPEEK